MRVLSILVLTKPVLKVLFSSNYGNDLIKTKSTGEYVPSSGLKVTFRLENYQSGLVQFDAAPRADVHLMVPAVVGSDTPLNAKI